MFEDYLATSTFGGSSSLEPRDELSMYLSTDCVRPDDPMKPIDPLKWWRDHRDTYPKLSAMAMDYLCIPGELFNLPTVILDHD
jgi:hypothetical protein